MILTTIKREAWYEKLSQKRGKADLRNSDNPQSENNPSE